MGRFLKHAFDMQWMSHRWKVADLMSVLTRDSIIYFFMYLFSLRSVCVGRRLTVPV